MKIGVNPTYLGPLILAFKLECLYENNCTMYYEMSKSNLKKPENYALTSNIFLEGLTPGHFLSTPRYLILSLLNT